MIGMTFNKFYDLLYYGADIDLMYDSKYYHISCGYDEKGHSIRMYLYDKSPDEHGCYSEDIYDSSNKNTEACIEQFLRTKLFDEKSIYDVCDDVKILYY